MGNLMIGGVYPSSMGDIRRIYCGEEQCWPKVIDPRFKRFILMDNKIDKNVLLAETHQAGMSFDFGGVLKYDGHHQMYLSFTKYQIGTDVYYKVIYKQYSKKDDEYNIIIGSTYEHLREIPQAGGKGWTWDDTSDVCIYLDSTLPVIDDDARIDISFRWIQEDQKGSRLTIPIRNLTYSQIKSGQVLEYVDDSLTLQVKGSVGLKGVTLTFLNTTEMFIDALHDGWIRGETTISSSYTGVELHVDNTFDVFVPNECFKAPPASSLTVAYIDMKAKRTPVLSFWINHIWQQAVIVYKNMPQTTVYQSFKLADGTTAQNTLIINTPVWLYNDNYTITYELKTTAPRGRLNGNPYGKPGIEGTDVTYTTEMIDFSGRLGKSAEVEWEITPVLQNRQHAFEVLFVDDEKTLGTGSIEFYNILAHKSFILSENAPDNTYNVGTFKVHTQGFYESTRQSYIMAFDGINDKTWDIYFMYGRGWETNDAYQTGSGHNGWPGEYGTIVSAYKDPEYVSTLYYCCRRHQNIWDLSINGKSLMSKVLDGNEFDETQSAGHVFPDGVTRLVKWHIKNEKGNLSCTVDTGGYAFSFEDNKGTGDVRYRISEHENINTNILI